MGDPSDTSEVSVRRLRREDGFRDLIVLSRAFFEAYETHHEALFRIDVLTDEDITGYFSTFLERDDRAAFVALEHGRVVGYITVYVQTQPAFWRVKEVGHISGLMVREEDRRRGIGSQLLEQARAYFRERGVRYYTVYTAAQNGEAIDFYARQGMGLLYTHLAGETIGPIRLD